MRHVLSIDGGGIRGLIPAVVLETVEEWHGPLDEHFDLCVGTSTGGILACGIGFGMAAQRMRNIYVTRARDIFTRSLGWRVKTANGLLGPKWPLDPAHMVLYEHWRGALFGSVATRVLCTAYDLDVGAPKLFKSWRQEDQAYSLAGVALATSAAPTYFPPYVRWIDGGVFASNPARIALTEARKLWPGEPISLLSLGTGTTNPRWDPNDVKGWGLAKWAPSIVKVIFDGASDDVHYHLEREPDIEYLRLQPEIEPIPMDTSDPAHLTTLRVHGERMAERFRLSQLGRAA